MLCSASIWCHFAVFCIDLAPFCSVLPRSDTVLQRSASIWVRFAGPKSLRNATKTTPNCSGKQQATTPNRCGTQQQTAPNRWGTQQKRPPIVAERCKKNGDPVPPGGRKTVAAGNPAFLLWPFGRSTHHHRIYPRPLRAPVQDLGTTTLGSRRRVTGGLPRSLHTPIVRRCGSSRLHCRAWLGPA